MFNKLIDAICDSFTTKNNPDFKKFSINHREFYAERDVDGWFWTDIESQFSSEGIFPVFAGCQQDAMVWVKDREQQELDELEEAEHIRCYGTDREQLNREYYSHR